MRTGGWCTFRIPADANQKCPICLGAFGASLAEQPRQSGGWIRVDCTACGSYLLSKTAHDDYFSGGSQQRWSAIARASLSHAISLAARSSAPANLPRLTSEIAESYLQGKQKLPSMPQQAMNIIRVIGDYEKEHGIPFPEPGIDFYTSIGSANPAGAARLTLELKSRGLLDCIDASSSNGENFMNASLRLEGWERWDAERKGNVSAGYGIIAMKFNDERLDKFVNEVVKPTVASINGLRLIRIDDEPQAGIIDNLLRLKIRDSAFLLADLTHANNGAYWEAGFAEGLGKPVIYLCEKTAWDERRTHFDTNHCTTVIWEHDDPAKLERDLVATIRNSLKLFV